MSEPDELYTLRAQFWLGHYNLALDEAKSLIRRPMSAALKVEREELVLRCHLALKDYDKVLKDSESAGDENPGIQAIHLRAQYESPNTASDPSRQAQILASLHSVIQNAPSSTTAQLIASQLFSSLGTEHTKDALAAIHPTTTMEQILLKLQIYIKMNRNDLAKEQLTLLQQADEESILTQLGSVYTTVANGRSHAQDAIHILSSLSEQYGPSIMLLNCTAVAYMVNEQYDAAEGALSQALAELSDSQTDVDVLINLLVCSQHQGKSPDVMEPYLAQLKAGYPTHPFVEGLMRVEAAFDRETVKYAVTG